VSDSAQLFDSSQMVLPQKGNMRSVDRLLNFFAVDLVRDVAHPAVIGLLTLHYPITQERWWYVYDVKDPSQNAGSLVLTAAAYVSCLSPQAFYEEFLSSKGLNSNDLKRSIVSALQLSSEAELFEVDTCYSSLVLHDIQLFRAKLQIFGTQNGFLSSSNFSPAINGYGSVIPVPEPDQSTTARMAS
jgi:hypothetical protein